MTEPLWLDRMLVLLLHEDILAATGGATEVMLGVAQSQVTIEALTEWLRTRVDPL